MLPFLHPRCLWLAFMALSTKLQPKSSICQRCSSTKAASSRAPFQRVPREAAASSALRPKTSWHETFFRIIERLTVKQKNTTTTLKENTSWGTTWNHISTAFCTQAPPLHDDFFGPATSPVWSILFEGCPQNVYKWVNLLPIQTMHY